MPKKVEVEPEDLHVSAATVDTHADAVLSGHGAADGRMSSATPGLPASAAAALGVAMTKWQEDTAAIYGRMNEHAKGMRTGAERYTQVDEDTKREVDQAAANLNLGL